MKNLIPTLLIGCIFLNEDSAAFVYDKKSLNQTYQLQITNGTKALEFSVRLKAHLYNNRLIIISIP